VEPSELYLCRYLVAWCYPQNLTFVDGFSGQNHSEGTVNSYMFSIVGVALCLYTCSYSAHSDDQGLGGRYCVSMVLKCCLPVNAPYISGHVVDHKGDYYSFVESSIVHSLNVGQVRLSCGVMSCFVLDPP
jgi:hypothetical protein